MDEDEVRIQARFDQINASKRDTMKHFRRARWALSRLPVAEQIAYLQNMTPMQVELFDAMTSELNDDPPAVEG